MSGLTDDPERQLHGYEMVYPTFGCVGVGVRVCPLTVTQKVSFAFQVPNGSFLMWAALLIALEVIKSLIAPFRPFTLINCSII